MADNRTEKATPKRREEATKRGQVARSTELNTALVLLVSLAVLAATAPRLLDGCAAIVARGLAQSGDPRLLTPAGLGDLRGWALSSALRLLLPVALAAAAAGVLASVLQVRPRLSVALVKPKLERLDPRAGAKRLFGRQALFEGTKAIVKTSIAAAAAFVAIWPRLPELAATTGLPPALLLSRLAHLVLAVGAYVGGALLLVALADFAWQKRRHERSLRMTREEVKQEMRQSDLAPEVRSAIRRRQFAQARKRMIADVATADVVVTNPTHFAVALRYDGRTPAPEVVAKGADLVAAAIRSAAEEHGVPVLSNPPLARALYRDVEIGQQIPDTFFIAVAEVLAFVYRAAGGRRRAA
jgi:flagellar biosynthetic protein FlhB